MIPTKSSWQSWPSWWNGRHFAPSMIASLTLVMAKYYILKCWLVLIIVNKNCSPASPPWLTALRRHNDLCHHVLNQTFEWKVVQGLARGPLAGGRILLLVQGRKSNRKLLRLLCSRNLFCSTLPHILTNTHELVWAHSYHLLRRE